MDAYTHDGLTEPSASFDQETWLATPVDAPAAPGRDRERERPRGALAFRSGGGRVVVVPAPVAAVGLAALFLAAGLSAFDPPAIRAAVLDRQAASLLRWETRERRRVERALDRLEPELRDLRRNALRAGIAPPAPVDCGAPDAEHLARHVAEAAELTDALLAKASRPAELDLLPSRSPIDLASGWVVSDHGAAENGVHVSSGKGARADPFTGRKREHHGLDLSAPAGTPVIAPAAGTVVFAGSVDPNRDHARGLLGVHVLLRHGATGYTTLYAHLSKADVRTGQKVKAGDRLGAVGSTGRSTAPHLHYQVMRGEGAARENLDPLYFITDATLVREGEDVWYVPRSRAARGTP